MRRDLTIDGRQKQKKRILEYFATIAGWTYIVVFLVQVLLSLLLWGIGIHYIQRFIISDAYIAQSVHLVLFTIELSGVVLTLTLYWSYYNKYRYGSLRRRKAPRDVSGEELSDTFNIPKDFVKQLRDNRWVDLDGEIEELSKDD